MKTVYRDFDGDVETRAHYDPNEDRMVLETVQDVEPYLERNKRLANEGDGYSKTREWRRVASIPNVIIEKWMREEGANVFQMDRKEFSAFIKKKLMDPDYRYLVTSGKPPYRRRGAYSNTLQTYRAEAGWL